MQINPEYLPQLLSAENMVSAGATILTLAAIALVYFVVRYRSFSERLTRLTHQKKSSEVRLGKISETLSPLLEDFPCDIKKPGTSTIFIGQPVDYIHFDPEHGISLIEVKSGNSHLSASQKRLKALVEAGQVRWVGYRVNGR